MNKKLVLRGFDKGGGKPVIDAGGGSYAITLSAGKSTLDGFTVVNAGNLHELAKEFKSVSEGFAVNVKMKNVRGDAGIRVASNNNIIRNNTASNNEEGIRVRNSINNIVSDNTAINNYLGIYLHYSKNNMVSGNTVSNNMANGIYLWYSNNNIITGNYVGNDEIVIDETSNYNIIYQNNHDNANKDGTNQWDNGINIGNYWRRYTGTDANNDGIGDTPYNISGGEGAQDMYPFMRVNGWLQEALRGDVNRNNRRDTGDATLILRNIVGLPIPSQYLPILPAGDMNCNSRIDTGDATLVLRDVVSLPIPRCWE